MKMARQKISSMKNNQNNHNQQRRINNGGSSASSAPASALRRLAHQRCSAGISAAAGERMAKSVIEESAVKMK
jgi:hypothetical protein